MTRTGGLPARRAAASLAALLSLAACGGGEEGETCSVPDGVDPDWIARIGCTADYELLWDERADSVFARTRTVNWLIDREDDREGEDRLYFIDTVAYPLHYFFAADYLDFGAPFTPVGTHTDFNLLNYRRADRRFMLGKLVHYLDQGLVTVELAAGDGADADLIEAAFGRLRDSIHNGDRLVYRPVSADQEAMLTDLAGRIPVVRTEAVFLGQSYQPLSTRVGFGTLRFRRLAELEARPPVPTDIVVLDRVPNDITMVSGIVTDELQTPLSHINILAKNRGTPNMGLRGAFDDPDLRLHEDRLVRLEVAAQDFTIAGASVADAEDFWDELRPAGALVPVFDLTATLPVDLTAAGAGDAIRIGAKAANLAEVARVEVDGAPVPTPDDPFAIPFYFYDQHMRSHGLDAVVDELLADVAAELDPDALGERLFDLRWRIYRAPMDLASRDLLVAEVRARWGTGERARFRSSTNVEDLPGFSGAGLYTSAGAPSDDDLALEDAIKVVWASAWNQQAFVERDFYRVAHAEVRMGVLVHPAMPDELANGVAITINEFASNRPAFYINAQLGEVSVTNPTGLAVPEQILFYTWYEEPEYEVITRSSLLAAHPAWPAWPAILTDDELVELAAYLTAIHAHFKRLGPADPDFAMDVEWKLGPGREVMIKQARPLARR